MFGCNMVYTACIETKSSHCPYLNPHKVEKVEYRLNNSSHKLDPYMYGVIVLSGMLLFGEEKNT
jgi:hypothetical protein